MVRVTVLLLFFAAAGAAGDDRPAHPVEDKALQRQINDAIDRGVRYLKSIQNPGGSWAVTDPRHDGSSFIGGYTCLALYALAASRVPKDDPAIRAGLAWIDRNPKAFDGGEPSGTYTNSLLILALTRIDPVAHRKRIHHAADTLIGGQHSDGMWTYTTATVRTGAAARAGDRAAWRKGQGILGIPDNSNTQFAALALWAAYSMADYDVPRKAWEKLVKHFRKLQARDGGWPYRKVKRTSTATMTAAGVVSLTYALSALDPKPQALARARRDPAVRRGLRILPLSPKKKGGKLRITWHNYYWVYSLERVGTVLGLDPELWYVPGARWLLQTQAADGRWPKKFSIVIDAGRVIGKADPGGGVGRFKHPGHYETSLALLFLTRGSYPPIKGALTEKRETKPGVITRKEKFPDVTTAAGLARAFGHYHAYKPLDRAAILPEFGKAGPAAVRLCIDRLRDPRAKIRTTAYELLGRLVAKPFLFEPTAPLETRQVMWVPIDAWFKKHGAALKWDAERLRFVR